MADRGACVSDCGAGRRRANSDNKCVPCDGPCPKGKHDRFQKLSFAGFIETILSGTLDGISERRRGRVTLTVLNFETV